MRKRLKTRKGETNLVGLVALSSSLSLVLDLGESSLLVTVFGLLGSRDGGVLALALEVLLRRVDLGLSLLRLLSDLASGSSVS